MFRSIRWRIAIPYVALVTITMAGVIVYLSVFLRQLTLSSLEEKLLAETRLLANTLAPLLSTNADPVTLDALAQRWAVDLQTRVTIIGPDGVVLGESDEDRLTMDNHYSRPEIQQARANGWGTSVRYSQTSKHDMLYVAVPVKSGEAVTGFVRLALPLASIEANVRHLQQALLGATLLAGLLAILLAVLIAGYTTRPLRELTVAAQRLPNPELEHIIIPITGDEIGQLAATFNQMASQLRVQFQALRTESSRLAAVLQQMTDGVVIADKEGLVQLINPAACRMFEVSEPEALGRSLSEVLRNHQIIALWQECRARAQSQESALELYPARLLLQCVATPLGAALPGSTLLLFQDLTRLRRLETVRRDFISNISHELRTPLASLKALTETLQAGALDDPPAAQRFLERMDTEVDALIQMVNELLELARIESGRVPLQLRPVAPLSLLEKAVERLHLQAERAELTIQVVCPAKLPDVLADPSRLEQVIVNLLHNAIKFTPAGGQIKLAVQLDARLARFSVQDTGIGISTEDLPRIFERFYKADRARSGGGTGLGLAIARHLVEAHGGRIWAASVEGQGSTFYFEIPLAQ